ncbi:MAG TPA: hypothetical protein C5S51_09335 [Methanosarcinaceae archaeon]|nr:hypothetical protein [Methanosarcinaceae archaeon]
MKTSPKILVIGLDGCSWNIFNHFLDDMPNLRKLMDNGVSGNLRSCIPPITFPAWKCYSTGQNPRKLGVFDFTKINLESKKYEFHNSKSFTQDEIWDYLETKGYRSCVIGMPTTYPVKKINGVMVAAGPEVSEIDENIVYPLDYLSLLKDTGFKIKSKYPLDKMGTKFALKEYEEIIRSHFRLARKLLETEDFDFFQITIFHIDTINHILINNCEKLKHFYTIIDEEIGLLLELVNDDTHIVMVSDHGMQKNRVFMNLKAWLEEHGYIIKAPTTSKHSTGLFVKFLRYLAGSKPGVFLFTDFSQMSKIRDAYLSALNKHSSISNKTSSADDNKCIDNDFLAATKVSHQCIYFLNKNVDENKKQKFIGELKSLKDPKYGLHPIRDIIYPKNYYQQIDNKSEKNMPDLILNLNDGFYLLFKEGCDIFDYEMKNHDYIAFHRRDGFYLISGKNIKSNSRLDAEIYDIAPTILHMLDVPVSKDMDGRVLKEIYVDNSDIAKRDVVCKEYKDTKKDMQQKIRGLKSLKKI